MLVDVSLHPNIDGVIPKRYILSPLLSRHTFLEILAKARQKVRQRRSPGGAITGTASNIHVGGVVVESVQSPQQAFELESVDLVIICALESPETEEMLKVVPTWTPETYAPDPTIYRRCKWVGVDNLPINVVLATLSQMGLTAAAVLATKVLARWQPRYLALVGIAAGLKGKPGDILFASSSFDYASGKISEGRDHETQFAPAGESLPADPCLLQWAQEAHREGNLLLTVQKRWPGGRSTNDLPALHIGPFACGPFVVSSSSFVADLIDRNRKFVALDMESYAVFNAVENSGQDCRAIVIKGASDNAVNKSDEHQPKAAFFAAQFLYEFAKTYLSAV